MQIVNEHPESYEAVETVVDSAFAPKDDPAFYEKSLKVCKLAMDAQEYDDKAKRAKSSMAIWSGPYQSAFGRTQYNEEKEKYDGYTKKVESLKDKIQKVGEEMKKLAEPGRRFIGYKVSHTFRAKNNEGNVLMGKYVYIMDDGLTKILAEYDTDSDEYQMVQAVYQRWEEESEEVEEE